MRVAYLAAAHSVHTVRWVNEMARRGHEVCLITMHPPSKDNPIDNEVTVQILPFSPNVGYISNLWSLRRLLRKIRPQLLHTHYASGYGTLSGLAGFRPTLLSVWGSDVFEFPRRSPIHAWLLRRNVAAADELCATSHALASELAKYGCRSGLITPFGIDCQQFMPVHNVNQTNKAFVIGTVKTLEANYGIEYLIRAFYIIAKKYPNAGVRLVIAGGGSRENVLRSLTMELGISSQVEFVGSVPHADVPQYLNSFCVYVAVSLLESFGVAILEASACGIPVVVSNVGGLPEVVEEGVTGFIVPPEDPEAIASVIEKLMLCRELGSRIGMAGREFVLRNYDWKKSADIMESIYDSVSRKTDLHVGY